MLKSAGERDCSAQEIMHHNLSLKLVSSSFQVINVSLEGSRKLSIKNDSVETEPSVLHTYGNRSTCIGCNGEILECNFMSFVAN